MDYKRHQLDDGWHLFFLCRVSP